MLTTPEKIRTLQRKLYRKAKQDPACRFHALYDKVYRADILSHAYALVRANKGSAGIDDLTFVELESREAVKGSPFVPETLIVHGLVYDLSSGGIEVVVNGYEA